MDWEKAIAAALDYVKSYFCIEQSYFEPKKEAIKLTNMEMFRQILYKIFRTFWKDLTAEWCKCQKTTALAFQFLNGNKLVKRIVISI